MMESFFIGPIKVEIINGSEIDNSLQVCDEQTCTVKYNLKFEYIPSLDIPEEVNWNKRRTYCWGEGEESYYLCCVDDRSLDLNEVDYRTWRCMVAKDFTSCKMVRPSCSHKSFFQTIIFTQILSGFSVSHPFSYCHGCVASINNKGIVFLGNSGAGKSTISEILTQSGSVVVTDDKFLLFKDENEMRIAAIPRDAPGPTFFNPRIVNANRIFVLDKNADLGEYKIDLQSRYLTIAETIFVIPDVLHVNKVTGQILKLFSMLEGIPISRLGFDKDPQSATFLYGIV